jgi:hypothetical protein
MSDNLPLQQLTLKKEYLQADKIIRYLLHPDDETSDLSDAEKKRFDILKSIHALRMRYSRKSDVVTLIQNMHSVKERQAYNYVQECEYVFGSLDGVHKAYERNFLLEASRKNIELAMTSRKSDLITKALLAHYKLAGLEEVSVELPDYSALEPNTYIVKVSKSQEKALEKLLSTGSLDLRDVIPTEDITFTIVDDEKKDE